MLRTALKIAIPPQCHSTVGMAIRGLRMYFWGQSQRKYIINGRMVLRILVLCWTLLFCHQTPATT